MNVLKMPVLTIAVDADVATLEHNVKTQPDLLLAFIEPFLKCVTPKGMFEQP